MHSCQASSSKMTMIISSMNWCFQQAGSWQKLNFTLFFTLRSCSVEGRESSGHIKMCFSHGEKKKKRQHFFFTVITWAVVQQSQLCFAAWGYKSIAVHDLKSKCGLDFFPRCVRIRPIVQTQAAERRQESVARWKINYVNCGCRDCQSSQVGITFCNCLSRINEEQSVQEVFFF